MILAEKLQMLRKKAGLSQTSLCDKLGVSTALYNKYEKQNSRPPYETILKIAKIYNVSVDALIDDEADCPIENESAHTHAHVKGLYPLDAYVRIPALGIIRGGQPICTEQGEYDEVFADAKFGDGNHFMLKVQGDSMSPTIPNGAWAIIEHTDVALPGQVVAFALDGEYATLKRYYPQEDGSIILKGDNPKNTFEFHITQEQLKNGEAHILGVCRHVKFDM